MNLIEIENLSKSYRQTRALNNLNLQVEEGKILGFLGPNGAGKTTTIRLLLGLLKPTSGRAKIFGLNCWSHSSEIKIEVAYVPGDLRIYRRWTPRIALNLVSKIRRKDILAPGLELAEQLNLNPDIKVREMSLGTRQKLGLILALATQPRLLILDEPTSGLDPIVQDRLREILLNFADEGGTVFFSSHTLSEIENLCDRITILKEGNLVIDTTLAELRKKALREIHLHWRHTQPKFQNTLPEELDLLEQQDLHWKLTLKGETSPEIMSWIHQQNPDDVSISPPNLETLFHSYYR